MEGIKVEDGFEKALKNMGASEPKILSPDIGKEINEEMEAFRIEFNSKQAKSIEAASRRILTF